MDIVERLRGGWNHDRNPEIDMSEAADEIERLRALNTKLLSEYEARMEQLATAKLEGFNEGIEAAAKVCNKKNFIADTKAECVAMQLAAKSCTFSIRALKREVV